MSGMSPDKLVRLKDSAANLRDCHFQWMIDAALDHFQEGIKEAEGEIVRHERFLDELFYDYRTLNGTRKEKIERANQKLTEYRQIVRFLRALSDISHLWSAQSFAQQVSVMFKNKKNV